MVDAIWQLAIMIEEIPLSVILQDGMVRSPAKHGFQNPSLISEGANRAVTNGINQVMGSTGGIGEIILSVQKHKLVQKASVRAAVYVVRGVVSAVGPSPYSFFI